MYTDMISTLTWKVSAVAYIIMIKQARQNDNLILSFYPSANTHSWTYLNTSFLVLISINKTLQLSS